MMGKETDEIIEKLFESLLQNQWEKGEFVRDGTDLLYYHLQKISLKRSGSCIDSPEWLKNKKVTINP